MKLKSMTLSFDPSGGGFDDAELQSFQRGKEVLELRDHFFVFEGTPRWALMIAYREEGSAAGRNGKGRRDWRSEVAEEERPLFDALRTWRNARAERDGAPPFVLFNNRQITEICRVRPESLEELRAVRGIGEAKARSFGQEVLAVVAATPPVVRESGAGTEDDTKEASDG